MDRHHVAAGAREGLTAPGREARRWFQPYAQAMPVMVGDLITAAELEPRNQHTAGAQVASAPRYELRASSHRREQRNVPRHQHHVEDPFEIERAHIGLDPGQLGRAFAGGSKHRRISVDPDNLDSAARELDADATRAAPGVEDGPRRERRDKAGLAVDVFASSRERIESALIVVTFPDHHPSYDDQSARHSAREPQALLVEAGAIDCQGCG